MSTNRERILQHALGRFNEEGLEAVGIRDIARDLGLSPGNVSYHFPKKDDLVAALAEKLAERNTAILAESPRSLSEFMNLYRQLFENQAAFSFLAVSIVHVIEHNSAIAGRYVHVEAGRRQRIDQILTNLQGHGLRDDLTETDRRRLVGHITLLARMWLSERRISFANFEMPQVIDHYLHLFASLFLPYTTPAGVEMLEPFLAKPLLS